MGYRYTLREPFAEFLGTLILVLFGNSANCQAFLSMNTGVVSSPRGVSCYLSTIDYLGGLMSFPRTFFLSTLAGQQVSLSVRLMYRANHFPLGVAAGAWVCAGISGGHINPAVMNQLAGHRPYSDSMLDHRCTSYLSRISLEESSNLHSCTNSGRCMRCRHHIRGLFPCHQRRGRRPLCQNHCQDGRPICSLSCASCIMMSAGIQD